MQIKLQLIDCETFLNIMLIALMSYFAQMRDNLEDLSRFSCAITLSCDVDVLFEDELMYSYLITFDSCSKRQRPR